MSVHDKTLRAKAGATLLGCARRIVGVYDLADDDERRQGARWYANGGRVVRDIAKLGGIDRERAAVVVGHLSPRTFWKRNIAGARQLVLTGRADACMGRNVNQALAALYADDPWSTFGPTAPKSYRFALNLLGHTDVVSVDVWAARVALGCGWGADWRTGSDKALDRMLKRAGVYEAIEDAYIRAGRTLGLPPTEVQAVTWIVARNGRAS